ncbi:four helix bundle protein [Cupriavidus sp.]|uniref:four helix bundle protein n=1 Tax=Cupriavidus sp. TaxID=1873897 RepID=UPI0025C42D96|nr:four helix bundle protein [Cupriavidus sp.]MCA3185989.1 four helix bundle protein [Cupriavidus sp.]MCA3193603.1 four helix bundle protein [Cupriavidus sp.]MCA3199993.1 four helix bundle protein [Cupriavidus sp.]MCA3202006.1 four helix bundle protein [Cupriavidus sp.]MCA3232216.1 four helix bundle protein [Cupriavidus sp.]
MALHTQLPIYKAAYGLLDVVTDLVKNMARDFKRSIGEKINAECIEIMVLVFRANVAADKSPHLVELLERLQVIELLLRLSMDKRLICRAGYAKAIELTTGIGKQANGWKKFANRPLHGGQGHHD